MKKNLVTVSILAAVHLACSSGSSHHDDDAGPQYNHSCPSPPVNLPTPTENCPILQTTFNSDYSASTPIYIKGKQADIIVGTKTTPVGVGRPFYFYWHGFLGRPMEDIAESVVNPVFGSRVMEEGGVVVGLYGDFARTGGTIILEFDNGHLAAADELLACALQQLDIDICRIYTSGMSMGGLMVTQMTYLRSNYLASAVSCSGGLPSANAPVDQNPANKLPVMIAYGGSTDVFPPFNFYNTSSNYFNDLKANGHFTIMCDHGEGHSVPQAIVIAAWQFLRDHPYGVTPEPYAAGIPATYPPYCSLENIPPPPIDAGTTTDAGTAAPDTGTKTTDTGTIIDGGKTASDAGTATPDTGTKTTDASTTG